MLDKNTATIRVIDVCTMPYTALTLLGVEASIVNRPGTAASLLLLLLLLLLLPDVVTAM
jgi:hypothetical protein